MWCWRRLLRVPWTARRSNQSILKEISLGVHWKDWCWSWNSSTLATSWEELTHWKRPWCWEGLGAEEEGDDRGWDGWMASPTQWTWVWVNSGSWWWRGKPDVLRFMGSQRVGHDWATELNWTVSFFSDFEAYIFFITTHNTSGPSVCFHVLNLISLDMQWAEAHTHSLVKCIFSERAFISGCHGHQGWLI